MEYKVTYVDRTNEVVTASNVKEAIDECDRRSAILSVTQTPTINYIWQFDFNHIIFANSKEICYQIALDAHLICGEPELYEYNCLGIAMGSKQLFLGTLQ